MGAPTFNSPSPRSERGPGGEDPPHAPLRIVVAPQALKGSLDAPEVGAAIASGVRDVLPDAAVVVVPVADGGEGTVRALVAATGGELRRTTVTGPLGEPVEAEWGLLGGEGVRGTRRARSEREGREEGEAEREGATAEDAEDAEEERGGERGAAEDAEVRGVGASGGRPAGVGTIEVGPTAVIEMAAASGLPLVPPERRNPLVTTTRGTGELMRAALDAGARRLLIGIGGSATNDGGAGMAQALGARLLDAAGRELAPGGAALADLARIDLSGLDARLAQTQVCVACDVSNPLTGPTGASAVYGPQKGATPDMVAQLDAALAHYAEVLRRDVRGRVPFAPTDEGTNAAPPSAPSAVPPSSSPTASASSTIPPSATASASSAPSAVPLSSPSASPSLSASVSSVVNLSADVASEPGAGAAGGLGAGLLAFAHAELVPGATLVLGALDFGARVAGADLVITAEGRLDEQTAYGKAPAAVARAAKAAGAAVIVLAGSIAAPDEALAALGFDAAVPLPTGPMTLAECMAHAPELVRAAAARAMRLMLVGSRLASR